MELYDEKVSRKDNPHIVTSPVTGVAGGVTKDAMPM